VEAKAWVRSWAHPAEVFLQAVFGSEKSAERPSRTAPPSHTQRPRAQGDGLPSWYRRKAGVRYETYDLGPVIEQGAREISEQDREEWNGATKSLKSAFSGMSRGGGISPATTERFRPSTVVDCTR